MKFVIALNFVILALIMTGLFFVSKANYRALNASSKYWSLAVMCDAAGLALLAWMFIVIKDFSDPTFLGTVANTLLFASLIYQTVSIHAVRAEITAKQRRMLLPLILVFAVVWDYFRLNAVVNLKILVFAVLALAMLLWQLYEIRKATQPSNQLKIIFYSVAGEVFFTCLRLGAVFGEGATIVNVEQLPMLGIFSLSLQYGLKIIAYAALVGYWSESLSKENAKTEFENEQFKALSVRQEKLIADLGRLNKAATAGVLAASIAHELSQPLQGVLLNNDLSRQELEKPQPDLAFLQGALTEQADGIHRMAQIIGTMRGVFTESGAVEQRVDLFDLMDRLGLLITPQAHKKGVLVAYQKTGEAMATVKVSEIQQVLLNLVGNAFDALVSSNTATPQIKLSFGHENGWVTCSIEDNGPGIPASMQGDVFKFLKTTKANGMGLGLWLSKYIVERNNGVIDVGPSPMGGAMFTIKFPQVV